VVLYGVHHQAEADGYGEEYLVDRPPARHWVQGTSRPGKHDIFVYAYLVMFDGKVGFFCSSYSTAQ
jgi:hypothetical protein